MKGWEYAQVEAVKAAAQGDEKTGKALAKLSVELQQRDVYAPLNAYTLGIIVSPILNMMGLFLQVMIDVFYTSIGKQAMRDEVRSDVKKILDIASNNVGKMQKPEETNAE